MRRGAEGGEGCAPDVALQQHVLPHLADLEHEVVAAAWLEPPQHLTPRGYHTGSEWMTLTKIVQGWSKLLDLNQNFD